MKIPIQLGDKVLYPNNVILIKDRDRLIESVYRGERQEVVAKNIPANPWRTVLPLSEGMPSTAARAVQ
jgi:hypothetical protein